MTCGSVSEVTDSGLALGVTVLVVVAIIVLDAVGLWFLLSHNVDVEEADDEVADMMGSLSLLAELGRVELAEGGHLLLILSLLTLFGREVRCNISYPEESIPGAAARRSEYCRLNAGFGDTTLDFLRSASS